MKKNCFLPADILLPKDADMTRWSVVACDQYTSEPEYWQAADRLVGDAPSTLRMILPEYYLEQPGVEARIDEINRVMREYVDKGIFKTCANSYIYLERVLKSGAVRRGLVGCIDLEQYDYSVGAESLVRATEGTVLSRIPPRVRVRENAPLETPHIMVLIDDEARTVIEPLASRTGAMEKVYDFPLMADSGAARGYRVPQEENARIQSALAALGEQELFEKKYNAPGRAPFVYAMGDGNHSLATAKACFEKLKETLPEAEWKVHPARWALCEIVNVHDEALQFEPIHRVVFDVDPQHFLSMADAYFTLTEDASAQTFSWIADGKEGEMHIDNPPSHLAVGSVQMFIDDYIKKHGGRVDYIHGDDVVRRLAAAPRTVGILLPEMKKSELFETVVFDGVLPRKTFSMGHAEDKRFYLECRAIQTAK